MDLGFGGQNQELGDATAQALGRIVGMQESMLDDEIAKLDNLEEADLAKIRSKRLAELKKQQSTEKEWASNGHGKLTYLSDTKEFFEACKRSQRVVCHFQRPTSHHCRTLDGHLARLAATQTETRFCAMDAEKTPYLCDKILADPEGNVVIPTILLCKDGKVVYHVRGLAEVGGEGMTGLATLLIHHGMIFPKDDAKPAFASLDEARGYAIRAGIYDDDVDSDVDATHDIQDA
ncbi:hypothetical protein CTAYLR_003508 [Chrysophaeum taylorii]|uniref:Thioredoxin domain-containing protein n=1 Tax=Chrysophaeum taylorii TaxID=2483200 RepID=A0AAD7UCC7_9STRA|nr:hypothetical protein CTAYLR_003508 [Chrysophaeum taylorii]